MADAETMRFLVLVNAYEQNLQPTIEDICAEVKTRLDDIIGEASRIVQTPSFLIL